MLNVWYRADSDGGQIVVPVGVILDVARARRVTAGEWAPILWPPGVLVSPLAESVATEIGSWSGELGVRHALWESRHLGWPVLTRQLGVYGPDIDVIGV